MENDLIWCGIKLTVKLGSDDAPVNTSGDLRRLRRARASQHKLDGICTAIQSEISFGNSHLHAAHSNIPEADIS